MKYLNVNEGIVLVAFFLWTNSKIIHYNEFANTHGFTPTVIVNFRVQIDMRSQLPSEMTLE